MLIGYAHVTLSLKRSDITKSYRYLICMWMLAIINGECNSLQCFCVVGRLLAWGTEGGLILSFCHLKRLYQVFKNMSVHSMFCHCSKNAKRRKTEIDLSGAFLDNRITYLFLWAQGQYRADTIQYLLSVTPGHIFTFTHSLQ